MRITTAAKIVVAKMITIDSVKAYIILAFTALVAVAFLASLGGMIYFKIREPNADIGLWVNVFLTCLGYVVGILTGLLGISSTVQPTPEKVSSADCPRG